MPSIFTTSIHMKFATAFCLSLSCAVFTYYSLNISIKHEDKKNKQFSNRPRWEKAKGAGHFLVQKSCKKQKLKDVGHFLDQKFWFLHMPEQSHKTLY